ncbi:protein translocase subunit [Blastocladiella emersonii ATCC 22665]|nr:protein translocase subunit [Blastocladiella emersonii ATCC 22665]
MSFFGGATNPSAAAGPSLEERKNQIMQQVRQELALANAQELINKVSDNCFKLCVTKPGEKLTEEPCLSKCMDRYLESWNVVSRAYVAALQKANHGADL